MLQGCWCPPLLLKLGGLSTPTSQTHGEDRVGPLNQSGTLGAELISLLKDIGGAFKTKSWPGRCVQ